MVEVFFVSILLIAKIQKCQNSFDSFGVWKKAPKKLKLGDRSVDFDDNEQKISFYNFYKSFIGKLFASSSFYSPNIHPTVEDQVELARRISHSLSDISNQQSKGQSMYSNRKKRSVKWIHDDGREEERFIEGK